ncbi:MAG: hypothetical protein JXB24_06330 [Bacteroidales bacterium]|nr:hypothetical protein [Bacteroidales bacterium]
MTVKRYTTKHGDTIIKIATWFYFNWELWPLIYYSNEEILPDPLVIPVPVKLVVPFPEALTVEQNHIAIDGDTSLTLSKKYYGVKWYYKAIDKANDFPDKYVVGTEYTIPALCDQVEIAAADDVRAELGIISVI